MRPADIMMMKINDYCTRHMGRYPARIFVPTRMYIELANDVKSSCQLMLHENGKVTFCGIPLSIFREDTTEKEIYLSDKEM